MFKLDPFPLFDGDCAEAMAFHRCRLGGELTIAKISDTPKGQLPPERHGRVAFAHLESGTVRMSATDWQHATRTFDPVNTVGAHLTSEKAAELKPLFDKLSVDSGLLDPLADMPFGVYGHLRDAYGVHRFLRAGRTLEGVS